MKENEKNNNDEVPKLSDTLTNYVVVKHKNKNKPLQYRAKFEPQESCPRHMAPELWKMFDLKCCCEWPDSGGEFSNKQSLCSKHKSTDSQERSTLIIYSFV